MGIDLKSLLFGFSIPILIVIGITIGIPLFAFFIEFLKGLSSIFRNTVDEVDNFNQNIYLNNIPTQTYFPQQQQLSRRELRHIQRENMAIAQHNPTLPTYYHPNQQPIVHELPNATVYQTQGITVIKLH